MGSARDAGGAGPADHPRTLGWVAATALAMGGSNQSLFLIAALFAGQGDIPGQGSAAVPLLIIGLLLAWVAAPGWTELVLMYPKRVGGIAATCAEAFRPYNPVLANLTGVCYWWGWVPTCGLTAIFSGAAIHEWYLPDVPVTVISCALVLFFAAVNLCGVKWAGRLAIPIATASGLLALISALAPIAAGEVDWQQATSFHLTVPFEGWFGELTGFMAGLYLIGFAAPAFEAAVCHVGEMSNPNRNVPRAMFASAAMASLYFIVLPIVWLGVLGPAQLGNDLMLILGPTFAPVFGSFAKAAAIWFMMFNMFHGTLQPLAGATRTISQLAEDGLLPRALMKRSRTDAPWVSTCLTAGMAVFFLLLGDPIWLVAAANFTYLIGICLPNVAVWLLRRNQPEGLRPYRAPRGMIVAGLAAAAIWIVTAVLGFQQFGMTTVLVGVLFAYSGSVLYAWRRFSDRRREGLPGVANTLHIKLTGAMLLVLAFDGAGYLLAVTSLPHQSSALVSILEDIFVAVAILSISVGLVLPGILAHAMVQVSEAATAMSKGAMASFSNALLALGRGDLDAAHARVDVVPVRVHSGDEVGAMAASVNVLQEDIARAAGSLDRAREELRVARHDALTGLITRREFERRLDAALAKTRAGHRWYALLYLDLDHFKVVNDTCGHAAGDELLRQITGVLRAIVRNRDSVARLGGDEFAMLLDDCPPQSAERIAQDLLEAVQGFSFASGENIFKIGCSIGLVTFCDSSVGLLELMRTSDDACYIAKKKGRNRVQIYQPADTEVAARQGELDWVGRLRLALHERRFCLYAQEIVVVSATRQRERRQELLVRMVDEEGGLVNPMAFIPVAERYNLMPAIDRLVIATSFEEIASIISREGPVEPHRWAINLSGASLGEDDFLRFVRTQFETVGVPYAAICFEITETAAIASFARATQFIHELKMLGCGFALDDFGSGLSSFGYLKHLPVAYLKIDGVFVRDIADDPVDRAMVEAINKVGQIMGIRTIAESVENAETLAILRAIGVDYAQGFGISRPQVFIMPQPSDLGVTYERTVNIGRA
ncbi:MAG TPA: amino acid permease [Casimicrobiaceae bacterium]|nr:amino acid permease [Casimicrobiaceae bacterium]